jgi:hypothetical protein
LVRVTFGGASRTVPGAPAPFDDADARALGPADTTNAIAAATVPAISTPLLAEKDRRPM